MGKTEPSAPMSRERILRAAVAVSEREGIGALSMRRLAQELDVWPMALYHYFRELLDAIAAHAAGELSLPAPAESWREQLRALLHAAREAMERDPARLGGSLARAFLTPEGLRLSEAALAILEDAGFDRREAASAWRSLWSYAFGYATFRLADTPEETLRTARGAIAALPDDDYPALLAAVRELPAALAGDEFDYGLDRLLDGIEESSGARA